MYLNQINRRELSLLKEELQASKHLVNHLRQSLEQLDINQRSAEGVENNRGQGAALVISELLDILKPNPVSDDDRRNAW